jgi:hypothetical protein
MSRDVLPARGTGLGGFEVMVVLDVLFLRII